MERLLLLVSFTFILVSCGKVDSNAGLPKERAVKEEILPLDGSNIQGIYLAKFTTLNPQLNGTIPGSATVMRNKDEFLTYLRLFGGAPRAWHQQSIRTGSRCPTMQDDLNRDGIIDIDEANKVWGNILIPLDANISSQNAGKNIYPVADESGSYFYERETSFRRIFKDLKSEDKDLYDNIEKISPEDGLSIEGKVVVVQGIAETTELPLTVATEANYQAYQTLPITCGIFKKIQDAPGELEENAPDPDPEEDNGESFPVPRPRGENENGSWVEDVIEWWRNRWRRWRDRRPQNWGDGWREIFS